MACLGYRRHRFELLRSFALNPKTGSSLWSFLLRYVCSDSLVIDLMH